MAVSDTAHRLMTLDLTLAIAEKLEANDGEVDSALSIGGAAMVG